MTTSKAIVDMFSQFQCPHKPHERDHAVGSQTACAAFCPRQMTVQIAKALCPNITCCPNAPAVPCFPCKHDLEHREKEQVLKHVSALAGVDAMAVAVETETVDQMVECLMDINGLTHEAYQIPKTDAGKDQVDALVTKLLTCTEMLNDPEALQKVDWWMKALGNTNRAQEKEKVRAEAKASGVYVHFGKFMTIKRVRRPSLRMSTRTNRQPTYLRKLWPLRNGLKLCAYSEFVPT